MSSDSPANPFLVELMRRLRSGRLRLTRDLSFYNSIHGYPDGTHVSTWFHTHGCSWDLRSGGCTMCNYALGVRMGAGEMLASVRRAFDEIAGLDVASHFVYSAGSTLDELEVPAEVRLGIWEILSRTKAPRAKTQASPEHVTEELAAEFARCVPDKQLSLHMGLESASPWVQRFCINRAGSPDDFARAAAVLRARGIRTRANVTLGAAFLSEREALDDAVGSMRWAFEHGADEADLLPVHVKPNTLLAELYALGLYRPVSLWSLVDALGRAGVERWPSVRFHGWYSSYPDRRKTVALPSSCPLCRERVLDLLGEAHHTWSRGPIEELLAFECRCKDHWRDEVARLPDRPLADRVLEAYGLLARENGLAEWWRENAAALESDLRVGAPGPNGGP